MFGDYSYKRGDTGKVKTSSLIREFLPAERSRADSSEMGCVSHFNKTTVIAMSVCGGVMVCGGGVVV